MKKRPKMLLAAAGVIASAAFYVLSGDGMSAKGSTLSEDPGETFVSEREEETFSEIQKEELRSIVEECITAALKEEVSGAVREVLSVQVEEMVENGTLSDGLKNCAEKEAGLVNVNTAGMEELKSLPGIGDVKAESIIRFREENGAFAAAEDLIAVDGISAGLLEKIRPYITV